MINVNHLIIIIIIVVIYLFTSSIYENFCTKSTMDAMSGSLSTGLGIPGVIISTDGQETIQELKKKCNIKSF